MTREPAGVRIAIRSDAAAIAAAHVASWRESYQGLLPEAMLAAFSLEVRIERWRRILDRTGPSASVVFVATRDDTVVGFGGGCAQRDPALAKQGFAGEINALYVLRRAQHAGTGRQLMAAVAKSLHERGHRAASVWVLRDNAPARRFYERLGGALIGEREDHRDGATLVEVAYGWHDLAALTDR